MEPIRELNELKLAKVDEIFEASSLQPDTMRISTRFLMTIWPRKEMRSVFLWRSGWTYLWVNARHRPNIA